MALETQVEFVEPPEPPIEEFPVVAPPVLDVPLGEVLPPVATELPVVCGDWVPLQPSPATANANATDVRKRIGLGLTRIPFSEYALRYHVLGLGWRSQLRSCCKTVERAVAAAGSDCAIETRSTILDEVVARSAARFVQATNPIGATARRPRMTHAGFRARARG